MVLWQSPDTPVMSGFHVSARLRVCSSARECALSRLCALFHVGTLCSDPGTNFLSFGYVSGFGHSRSTFCLFVWVYGLEFARPHALLSTCLRAFMLSCLVWIRGWWVFSNRCVFMSCFAHGWWFFSWPCVCVFVWAHGFCLSFLCAMCSHVYLSWPHPSCNLPHLSSLVTLLICSLYNLLVFAVPVLVRRLTSYVSHGDSINKNNAVRK